MTEEEKAAAELAEANDNAPTEINKDDLLAAVSAAVDEQTITPEKKDEDTDDTDDTDDGAADDGKLDADGGLDSGSESGSDDTDGDDKDKKGRQTSDTEVDDDDGTAGKNDSGDAASKADDKTGDKTKDGDDDAANIDHVNDPIPEATNEKTAARIKSLIGLVKEQDGASDQRDEIMERITESGADPEQYANTLGFLKLYNSKDMKDRKTALDVMRGMVKELALDVGEGATVTNLQEHDDLLAEVEAGTLTEKRAVEIATTRERQTMLDNRTTVANEKAETENQTQENIKVGKGQLDVLETSLRSTVENYEALRPMFIGLLKPLLRRTHPSEWGVAAQEVFTQVQLANPKAAAPKPKQKPENTPLRPNQSAGGGGSKKVEGGTVVDAVTDALAGM